MDSVERGGYSDTLRKALAEAREQGARDLAAEVVAYADLTHEVVVNARDVSEIADAWSALVAKCREVLA